MQCQLYCHTQSQRKFDSDLSNWSGDTYLMSDQSFQLLPEQMLDSFLSEQSDSAFPDYLPDRSQKSYPARYEDFKLSLNEIHNSVELGAMAAGANQWMNETIQIINNLESKEEAAQKLDKLKQSDPIVHLNNHGSGHVEKVIAKASEMLHFFEHDHLTPYEAFFLLCAIQIHDVGNVFGRERHEQACKTILEEKGKQIIPDSFERKIIEKLALVHGGAVDGQKDTISLLSENKNMYSMKVRKRLLAAILRFADEMADDCSRADRHGLANDTILEGSRIYHRYSEALHTVKIDKNTLNGRFELNLSFEFDSDIAMQTFKKYGQDKYLLDEIYDRTLKMECERRYCMRFLRPCFSLDAIKVEIVVQSSKYPLSSERYEYVLEEKGYPIYPMLGHIKDFSDALPSGDEEKRRIESEWGGG